MKQIITRSVSEKREHAPSHHVIVAAALLTSAALAGCSARPAAATPADTAEPIAVSIAQVAMTDVGSAIDSGGVVQARTTATIAARILAPVRKVLVSPGDQVREGQTLLVLDGDDLGAGARAARSAALAAEQGSQAATAEVQAAEAGRVLARASHDRIAGLQARRSATAQELDDAIATLRIADARVAGATARARQAVSAVESARAASDQASTTESFTTIVAPFDGMVTEKTVEPGNMALPGMPLLRLEDTRGFRLEVRVDESRIGQIRTGDSVPVFPGTAITSITGTVVEVSRAVDADARAFLVKIALPDAAARGESLTAFDGRCIPAGCVAPSSNTAGILGRPHPNALGNAGWGPRGRALPAGRLDRLDASPASHHGLPGLRSGEFGKARFGGLPRRALTIPASAIVRRGQLTSVFVVDNGVARLRLVNLSESEVLAGLSESEVVILSPPAGLTDGRRISVGGR
ncbi:MAG: HlyD family efflux transporter periplasmic adaptor subunit [Acidobacteriota bacterium]